MKFLRQPEELRRACDQARASDHRVGVVPTMGALHAGHLALVGEARQRAGFVAVTIFVNPTQFGPGEDLSRYPRTLERDLAACENAGVDCVFAPDADAMYPPGDETRVRVGATAAPLCGVHRPGHFEGVATVVAKLFALAGPCVAVFGRKDYQQLQVVRRFTADLLFPVEIVGVKTVREADGLAMSSRNAYLSTEARRAARAIPLALSDACRAFARGERRAGALTAPARERLVSVASSIDYVDVAHPESLSLFAPDALVGERALLAVAIRLGGARLIDNVVLGEDDPPVGEDGQEEAS